MSDPNEPAASAGASGEGAGEGSLLVVDIGKKQTQKRIRAMRKGRGKLFDKISDMVAELKSNGTIKGDVQPLVIVVRRKERRRMGW